MNERALPPELEVLPPLCPLCGASTDPQEGGFFCDPCGIGWDGRGRGRWEGDGEPQCPVTFEYYSRFAERCLLEEGHKGPHRALDGLGRRVQQPNATAVSP